MNILIVLPILIPLVTAALCLLAWQWRRVQRIVGLCGSAALLVASIALFWKVNTAGIQVTSIGNWPIPFGIVFAADLFGSIMLVLGAIMGFAVSIYSLVAMDQKRESFGYYPLFQVLMMGVSGAFLTGDIFNLYVWFEVLLMASFVLLSLGGERGQIEGAIKYVALNLVSSALFLAAVGILYGTVGTLNFADLAVVLRDYPNQGLITTLAMLFIVAFGIKAASFPFFFWLPASYHTPPVPVSAIFAGLLTKVGVYALIRVFTLLFRGDTGYTHEIILVMSGLTMLTGIFGAVTQNDMRRILSFHIVSQIGYMLMGLGLFTKLALAGSVFYIIHHIVVKTNLFLVSGVVEKIRGTTDLKKLGGLYRSHPWLSVFFLISALSLAGIPPLSGFFAKLVLIQGGLEIERVGIVAIALGVGLLTLFSMTKIWNEVFWKNPPEPISPAPSFSPLGWMLPVIALAAITVCVGVLAGPIFDLTMRTSEQLLNQEIYISAVLGARP